jgi:Fe-S-cluster containining protein
VSDPELEEQVRMLVDRIDELEATQAREDELVALNKQASHLAQMLVARGAIAPDDQLVGRLRRARSRPLVKLVVVDDKRAMKSATDLDCGALMHLCHGRCCTKKVALSPEDLAEGKLEWDLREPYLLAKAADGYCKYQDEKTGFCGVYEHRPAVCRVYDCRNDPTIWLDFDQKIPAPFETLALGCVERRIK